MNDTALIPRTELEKISPLVGCPVPIEAGEDQISVVQFWRVLQKRRSLVLGTLGIVVLLAVTASLLLPKRYDASARILLDLEGNDDLGLEQIVDRQAFPAWDRSRHDLEAELELLEIVPGKHPVLRLAGKVQLGVAHLLQAHDFAEPGRISLRLGRGLASAPDHHHDHR